MFKSKYAHHKIVYDVVYVDYWPKMLRFRKMTSGNLKIRKLPLALAISNFQELFLNKFDLKSSWFEEKSFLLKEFITKK